MIDIIKKSMFMGIGFASITRDKIEEVVSELKNQGAISESEGKKLIDDFLAQTEKSKKDIEKTVASATESAFEKLDLARRSDVEELKLLVKDLQEQIKEMRSGE